MALLEEQGFDLKEVTTARGVARLWTLTPTIYVTQVRGHVDEAHAGLFEVYGQRRVDRAQGQTLTVFHDWLEMTGYESVARQRMTSWSMDHLKQFGEVHLALRSKLVAMGVQVANIALRGLITVHNSRAPMEAILSARVGQALTRA